MEILLAFMIAAMAPGLAMAAGHWFPWRRLLNRDLSRPECYIYGCCWIIGVPSTLLILAYHWQIPASPLVSVGLYITALISAGAATLAAYAIDNFTSTENDLEL